MRVFSYRDLLAGLGVEPVAVGFSPPGALSELAHHLDWPYRFLSDGDRALYDVLGLGRAGPGGVFTAATRAIYRDAAARGVEVSRPVEDIRQLGGDAVAVDGTVVALWRPASPDDRPPVADIVSTLEAMFG